ncbi:hypothetical protein [Tatumella sp. UCD-D_suzukii]|nr:hypothetical protein [Tatumella sp. UCD-D_suzukii]
MSKRMLSAIEAIAKGERCAVPAMKFSEFNGFMQAIRIAQNKLVTK